MPFLVNGRELNFNERDDSGKPVDKHAAKVEEGIKTIKKDYKLPVRFKYVENYKTINPEHPSRPEQPANIPIKTIVTVKGDNGQEIWQYYETSRPSPRGDKLVYGPSWVPFSGSMMIGEDKIDKLYFMIFLCPHVKNGLCPSKARKSHYLIEDKYREAKRVAEKEAEIARVKMLIYDDSYGLGEKKLISLAMAYYIPGVEDLTLPEIQNSLWKTVEMESKSSNDAFSNFIDNSGIGETIRIRALVQEAIEKKCIDVHGRMGKKTWRWMDDKEYGETICSILPGRKPKDVLIEHLSRNREDIEILKNYILGETHIPDTHDENVRIVKKTEVDEQNTNTEQSDKKIEEPVSEKGGIFNLRSRGKIKDELIDKKPSTDDGFEEKLKVEE